MIQDSMEGEYKQWLKWCLEDVVAANFLKTLFEIAHIGDDIADGDLPPTPENISRLLHKAMVEIEFNQFYQQHKTMFLPLISTSITIWGNTDKWKLDGRETFGFAYREILEQSITMTALIKGGWDYSYRVTDEVNEFYHHDDETPETWKQEK